MIIMIKGDYVTSDESLINSQMQQAYIAHISGLNYHLNGYNAGIRAFKALDINWGSLALYKQHERKIHVKADLTQTSSKVNEVYVDIGIAFPYPCNEHYGVCHMIRFTCPNGYTYPTTKKYKTSFGDDAFHNMWSFYSGSGSQTSYANSVAIVDIDFTVEFGRITASDTGNYLMSKWFWNVDGVVYADTAFGCTLANLEKLHVCLILGRNDSSDDPHCKIIEMSDVII